MEVWLTFFFQIVITTKEILKLKYFYNIECNVIISMLILFLFNETELDRTRRKDVGNYETAADLGAVMAPGILARTLERSTPVKALTAGGICPTNRVMSEVVLSGPPISTISSVLASGAATSAAICKDILNINF